MVANPDQIKIKDSSPFIKIKSDDGYMLGINKGENWIDRHSNIYPKDGRKIDKPTKQEIKDKLSSPKYLALLWVSMNRGYIEI